MKPIHFMVLFWGEKYREHYFCNLFLPSMLSSNNLPLLNARDGHKFFISTTKEDWQRLITKPIFDELCKHVTPVLVEIGHPVYEDDDLRAGAVWHQSILQPKLLWAAKDPRAYGSVQAPDTIVADGMVKLLLAKIKEGCDLIILPALRQAEEPILESFKLPMSPRQCATLAIRHLHKEIHPYIEPIDPRINHTSIRIWKMGTMGYLFHTYSGLAILMDFAKVKDDWLGRGTCDMSLFTDNYTNCNNVHVVSDSDEASLLSLTPKDSKHFASFRSEPVWEAVNRMIEKHLRMHNIRMAHKVFATDHVRRATFRHPIRWHHSDLDDRWFRGEKAIEDTIRHALHDKKYTKPHPVHRLRVFGGGIKQRIVNAL